MEIYSLSICQTQHLIKMPTKKSRKKEIERERRQNLSGVTEEEAVEREEGERRCRKQQRSKYLFE
ncbi:hypothetical protein YC2023_007864 [Brassica napus]